MPLRFKSRVIAHLRDSRYTAVDLERLAQDVGVDDAERDEFETAITQLLDEKQITKAANGRFVLPPIGNEITGRIKIHPKGFAFLIPEVPNREGDLFIPAGDTLDAATGDIVRAEVHRSRTRSRNRAGQSAFVGEVVEVLERARSEFVGTLTKQGKSWYVEIDGGRLQRPVVVRDVGAKNATQGDKVVVEIVHYPEGDSLAEGVILERLGKAGRPDVETEAVIRAFDLPGPFPEACLDQARTAASSLDNLGDELERREDIRETFTLTIDPPDARDFDDAISIRKLDDGGYELGVHIADVAFFVTEGSPLDKEARERGNSVYLPRHVIPMLPEVLSNGVCSLQEDVDRLAKSAFVTYGPDARVKSARFAGTIIRSNKRLTYLEAEALIQNDPKTARTHAMSDLEYPEPLIPAVQLMSELATRIRERRMKDGMIVLTLPEVDLIFNDEGKVTGAQPEDDASTHGLIEMFMVEANEAIARLCDSLRVPLLRRTHPDPSTFDLGELRQFCSVAGVNIPRNPTRFELQKILDLTRSTPRQQAVHLAILRSMTRAEYSPALIGHFALASTHYAHFTSPIRRYPDLLVHRVLQAYLEHTQNGLKQPKGQGAKKLGRTLRSDPRCLDEGELITIGKHCNDTERNAAMAESSLRQFLVLQFLAENHLGDEMEGIVAGVTSQAVFVQLDGLLVEGFINVRDIPVPKSHRRSDGRSGPRQRWRLNHDTGALTLGESGASITIGDRVRVQISLVDPAARKLDLVWVDRAGSASSRGSSKPKSSAPKRKGKGKPQHFKNRRSARKQRRRG